MTQAGTTGITHAELVGFITAATTEVFSMMLGTEVTPEESFVQTTATAPASGIVSLVGLAGDWVGTGSISCSGALGCRVAGMLLGAECDAINEDVLDAFAEVTNMIIGNVKTAVEERLGPMGLSVPTVIFGRNFQTRNAGNHEWIVVPFAFGTDRMHVQLCLLPSREAGQKTLGRPGFPMPNVLSA